MVVLTLIDRLSLQVFFFLHISQMHNVSTFGNTADIYAIVHLVPVSISRSTKATVAVSPSGKSGQLCARAFP